MLKRQPFTLEITTSFFHQLASLFQAGISLTQCFDLLKKTQTNPTLTRLIELIGQDVLQGKTLYLAMRKHYPACQPFIHHLIRVGELTGKLDHYLNAIATHLEQHIAFRNQLRQLLFYPCFVLTTAFIVSLVMFTCIIPHFEALFRASPNQLPWLTRCVFFLSHQLRTHYTIFFALIIASFIFLRSKIQRHNHDQLPLLGKCLRTLEVIHFTKQLAVCLSAGIHISDAMLVSLPESHSPLKRQIPYLVSQLNHGQSLYQSMQRTGLFPPLLLQMVYIGEAAGTLDQMLNQAANTLESDIKYTLSRLAKLAEPLILLVLGVVIGGIVIGMYLPIFSLGNVM